MNLEQALARIVVLESENATLQTTVTESTAKVTDLEGRLQEKGLQFKKLRDLTKEEKEAMTEKEIELMQRQEVLEEDRKKDATEQANWRKEQRESLIKEAIDKYARGDADIAAKIRLNFDKIKESDLAITKDTLAPLVETSVNMMGKDAPDPLRTAHNTDGTGGDITPKDGIGFAETQGAKDMATAMGIVLEAPKAPEGGEK